MTDYADDSIVKAAIKEQWSEDQVRCRAYGHRFNPMTVKVNARYKYIEEAEQCERCGRERWRELNMAGFPLTPWRHERLDGYALEGVGRIGPSGRALMVSHLMKSRITERLSGKDAPLPRSAATREALGIEDE